MQYKTGMRLPLSILDLAPVAAGSSACTALHRCVDLARLGERLGYVRHWFAEHHSMPSVASAAPEILIAHVAAATTRIRVGSGGIMLPNHAPLRIAESFHALAALHPGRIDLGIGRAPGSDVAASRALRAAGGDAIGQQLSELLAFSRNEFPQGHPYRGVHAEPVDAALPPIWLLGSSGASARMAGQAGMGYSFASHFSPAPAAPAFAAYRAAFQASADFPQPHAILGMSVVCAPTTEEAEYHAATMDLAWLRIRRGEFLPLPSPDEALAYPYSAAEREAIRDYRALTVVGDPAQVRERIERAARECRADEVMIVSNLHDPAARLRSYELVASAFAYETGR